MKADFQYSTDFYGMNSYELSHTCMHLLCLAGEASFVPAESPGSPSWIPHIPMAQDLCSHCLWSAKESGSSDQISANFLPFLLIIPNYCVSLQPK